MSKSMEGLFNNKTWKIIKYLLDHPTAKIHGKNLAKELRISEPSVSVVLKLLRKIKFVKGKNIDILNPKVRAMKIAFNIEKASKIIKNIVSSLNVSGIGVYGSWAKGTNNENSDIDLWINVKENLEAVKLAKLRREIREKINVEPSFLILTKEKIEKLKKDNPVLYFSLIYSFLLWGAQID